MNKGLDTFISFALVILIGLTGVMLALTLIKPTIDKATDNMVINEGFANLEKINKIINDVASETEGTRRTINVRVTDGEYQIDSTNSKIIFLYKMKSDLSFSGSKGNVNITTDKSMATLSLAYDKILLQGSRFSKGDNQIVITNEGIDEDSNKVTISIMT